jgi:hypothetical protein
MKSLVKLLTLKRKSTTINCRVEKIYQVLDGLFIKVMLYLPLRIKRCYSISLKMQRTNLPHVQPRLINDATLQNLFYRVNNVTTATRNKQIEMQNRITHQLHESI